MRVGRHEAKRRGNLPRSPPSSLIWAAVIEPDLIPSFVLRQLTLGPAIDWNSDGVVADAVAVVVAAAVDSKWLSNDFDGATHPLVVRHGDVCLLMVELLLLLVTIAASVVADAAVVVMVVSVAPMNCSVSDAAAPDEKQAQQQQQQQQPS